MTLESGQLGEAVISAESHACPVDHNDVGFNPFAAPNFAGLHPMMEQARNESPVHYSKAVNMWVVTRYDDALSILRDPDTFSSSTRPVILSHFVEEARQILEHTHTFSAPNLGFDGRPEHDRLRRPVSSYFSAKGIARREPRIRELAQHHLERIPTTGPVDLNQSFAGPLASSVILDLVGLPGEDYDEIMRYHDAVAAFFFGAPTPDTQVQYARDVRAWEEYLADFVVMRRQQPADDLTSHLLRQITSGDAEYSEEEVISFLSFDVVTAGIRPTVFVLGNLCRELLQDRRHWDLLIDQPALFDNMFSESLRRRGLSLGVFRQATKDVEINGTTIPQDAVIWVLIASTSHDEKQFPDPDVFNPHRQNLSGSLHFSHGLHYCLGSFLARAVTRIGLELLMRRHPNMRLTPDQPIEFEPSMNLMIPKTVLVEW